jgi:hypothetical protein
MSLFTTILILKIGEETCKDPTNNNGTLVVRQNQLEKDYQIHVVGGSLPNGEETRYCEDLAEAMEWVSRYVALYAVELAEEETDEDEEDAE